MDGVFCASKLFSMFKYGSRQTSSRSLELCKLLWPDDGATAPHALLLEWVRAHTRLFTVFVLYKAAGRLKRMFYQEQKIDRNYLRSRRTVPSSLTLGCKQHTPLVAQSCVNIDLTFKVNFVAVKRSSQQVLADVLVSRTARQLHCKPAVIKIVNSDLARPSLISKKRSVNFVSFSCPAIIRRSMWYCSFQRCAA